MTEERDPFSPEAQPPVQFLFAMGQLSGTVAALGRSVDAIPAAMSSLARRVDNLEADNDRRKGQNSVIIILTSTATSIVVGLLVFFVTRIAFP